MVFCHLLLITLDKFPSFLPAYCGMICTFLLQFFLTLKWIILAVLWANDNLQLPPTQISKSRFLTLFHHWCVDFSPAIVASSCQDSKLPLAYDTSKDLYIFSSSFIIFKLVKLIIKLYLVFGFSCMPLGEWKPQYLSHASTGPLPKVGWWTRAVFPTNRNCLQVVMHS